MFLEKDPQGVPVKEKKPSELLREGIPHVRECHNYYLTDMAGYWRGCANGTMAYAAGIRGNSEAARWANNVLGPALKFQVNVMHCRVPHLGGMAMTREQIADYLESVGK